MTHSTAIHVQPSTLGGPMVVQYRCEAAWQLSMPVSWKYLYFEFSLYSLFFAIYPKLLNIFYSTLVAFIPQE